MLISCDMIDLTVVDTKFEHRGDHVAHSAKRSPDFPSAFSKKLKQTCLPFKTSAVRNNSQAEQICPPKGTKRALSDNEEITLTAAVSNNCNKSAQLATPSRILLNKDYNYKEKFAPVVVLKRLKVHSEPKTGKPALSPVVIDIVDDDSQAALSGLQKENANPENEGVDTPQKLEATKKLEKVCSVASQVEDNGGKQANDVSHDPNEANSELLLGTQETVVEKATSASQVESQTTDESLPTLAAARSQEEKEPSEELDKTEEVTILDEKDKTEEVIILDENATDEAAEVPSSDPPVSSEKECTTPLNIDKKQLYRKIKRNDEKQRQREKRKQEKLADQQRKEKLRKELQRQRHEAKQRRENEIAQRRREKQEQKEREEKLKLEKQKLKENEKKKKLDLLEAKLEEKKQREREKQQREEEKKKAEEEQQSKNKKAKDAFVNFFLKKDNSPAVTQDAEVGIFSPCLVKGSRVKAAPIHRNHRTNLPELVLGLDEKIQTQETQELYLNELKDRKTSLRNVPDSEKIDDPCDHDDDVRECDPSGKVKTKAKLPKGKLYQFSENVRPPYWGTWRKSSALIGPRRPFAKDKKLLDYEVESDDEWEEEEPGESLSHSEDDKESEDEYEVDNEFFVPHGYLSEEEACNDDAVPESSDIMKAQLKMKEREFEKDMKKKCQKINPQIFGCFWMADHQPGGLSDVMVQFSAVFITSSPIETSCSLAASSGGRSQGFASPGTPRSTGKFGSVNSATANTEKKKKKKELSEEEMTSFIRLVHGNPHRREVIVDEFASCVQKQLENISITAMEAVVLAETPKSRQKPISKSVLTRTLKTIASWDKFPEAQPLYGNKAWRVHKEIQKRYGLLELPLPNQWKYTINIASPVRGCLAQEKLKPLKNTITSAFLNQKKKKSFRKLSDMHELNLPQVASPSVEVITLEA